MSAPPPQPQVSLDIWMTAVTVIQIMAKGSAPQPCNVGGATGFFYERGENKYLVTNRHVVVNEDRGFYPDSLILRVHTDRNNLTLNREITVPLYRRRRPVWLEHPTHRDQVDVVAIKLNTYIQPQDFITWLSARNFPPSDIVLGLGDLVLVMGYPMRFYDATVNLPITKTGTIASPYGIEFRRKPYFLIDANLQVGTSGSPVILPASSIRRRREGARVSTGFGGFPPHLLGVNSGVHVVEGVELGLNVVWYAKLIQDIV